MRIAMLVLPAAIVVSGLVWWPRKTGVAAAAA